MVSPSITLSARGEVAFVAPTRCSAGPYKLIKAGKNIRDSGSKACSILHARGGLSRGSIGRRRPPLFPVQGRQHGLDGGPVIDHQGDLAP